MHDDKTLPLPKAIPEPGFYYHYKHSPDFTKLGFPNAGIQNYAYEVLNSLGFYTEDDGPADRFRVKYLPLYPWALVFRVSEELGRIVEDDRPLSMFMEQVPNGPEGMLIPRFTRITDTEIIHRLTEIRDAMYGEFPPIQA